MRANWSLPLSVLLSLGLGFVAGCDGDDDNGGDGDGDTGGEVACGEDWLPKDPANAMPEKLPYEGYGLPCTTPADCTDALGPDAICIQNILGVFDIPGGFCSIDCEVPPDTVIVRDAEECSPNGGVDCVGIEGAFTACLPSCENNAQCNREGYGCVQMPIISMPSDPTYCLMNQTACCSTDPDQCST